MKTTAEYFKMNSDELLTTDEYGYTREENKIYGKGLKVHFCEDVEEYEEEKEDVIQWYEEMELNLILELQTINGRIAMIFN